MHRLILLSPLALLLVLFLAVDAVADAGQSPSAKTRTSYHVTVPDRSPETVHVEAQMTLQDTTLYMSPNGPVPERWAEYVRDLRVVDQHGRSLPATLQPEGHWTVDAPTGQAVTLSYDIHLTHDQRSWPGGIDGVAFTTDWGLFITGRALFVMNGADAETAPAPIRVRVDVPDGWTLTAPWMPDANAEHAYYAADRNALTESMLMAGVHEKVTVTREGLTLQFALGGDAIIAQKAQIQQLATQVTDYYLTLMGGPPVPRDSDGLTRSLVIINASDQTDGEVIGPHISMLMNPDGAPQEQLVSWMMFAHEFFHLWNGKTITPASTHDDWFKEGITSYYAAKALHHVGLLNEPALLGLLNGLFYQRYTADPGFGTRSMRDAASALEKDAHWGLVYGGGLFAGIALDLQIREATQNAASLDDLMRRLYQRQATPPRAETEPYTTADVQRLASEVSSTDLSAFFTTYVEGATPVPIHQYLAKAGYEASIEGGQLTATPAASTELERALHRGFLGE